MLLVWPDGVMVTAWDLRLKRSRVQSPAVLLSGNNHGQVVDVVYCIYASVTKQYKVTLVKKR